MISINIYWQIFCWCLLFSRFRQLFFILHSNQFQYFLGLLFLLSLESLFPKFIYFVFLFGLMQRIKLDLLVFISFVIRIKMRRKKWYSPYIIIIFVIYQILAKKWQFKSQLNVKKIVFKWNFAINFLIQDKINLKFIGLTNYIIRIKVIFKFDLFLIPHHQK